jgi:hypothetical protein
VIDRYSLQKRLEPWNQPSRFLSSNQIHIFVLIRICRIIGGSGRCILGPGISGTGIVPQSGSKLCNLLLRLAILSIRFGGIQTLGNYVLFVVSHICSPPVITKKVFHYKAGGNHAITGSMVPICQKKFAVRAMPSRV